MFTVHEHPLFLAGQSGITCNFIVEMGKSIV